MRNRRTLLVDVLVLILVLLVAWGLYSVSAGLTDLADEVNNLFKNLLAISAEMEERFAALEGRIVELENELTKWELLELEVTAYAPFDNKSGICNDGNPNSTATGTVPRHGTVAVNPAVFPYGTKFYIPGYGWGVAKDTGSAIRARTDLIDIFKPTYTEAILWGRKRLWVLVSRCR